jgi:hypothetical protein
MSKLIEVFTEMDGNLNCHELQDLFILREFEMSLCVCFKYGLRHVFLQWISILWGIFIRMNVCCQFLKKIWMHPHIAQVKFKPGKAVYSKVSACKTLCENA